MRFGETESRGGAVDAKDVALLSPSSSVRSSVVPMTRGGRPRPSAARASAEVLGADSAPEVLNNDVVEGNA